jgi:hypothetical protein
MLVAGRSRTEAVFIPFEFRGKARSSQFASQFVAGNWIVCRGHLAPRTAACPPLNGTTPRFGAARSHDYPTDLVVAIRAVFHADLPFATLDARRPPPRPFWQVWTEQPQG